MDWKRSFLVNDMCHRRKSKLLSARQPRSDHPGHSPYLCLAERDHRRSEGKGKSRPLFIAPGNLIPRLDASRGFRHKNQPLISPSSPSPPMKLRLALIVAAFSFVHAALAGPRFLNCDYNGGHVSIVAADGSIEWQVDAKNPQDCWLLPNGNILFAYLNGAKEMTRDKQVVWEYKAPEKVECHAAQPLPNGNVLVVECGTSRIIEVDRKGEIAKEIKLTT